MRQRTKIYLLTFTCATWVWCVVFPLLQWSTDTDEWFKPYVGVQHWCHSPCRYKSEWHFTIRSGTKCAACCNAICLSSRLVWISWKATLQIGTVWKHTVRTMDESGHCVNRLCIVDGWSSGTTYVFLHSKCRLCLRLFVWFGFLLGLVFFRS